MLQRIAFGLFCAGVPLFALLVLRTKLRRLRVKLGWHTLHSLAHATLGYTFRWEPRPWRRRRGTAADRAPVKRRWKRSPVDWSRYGF